MAGAVLEVEEARGAEERLLLLVGEVVLLEARWMLAKEVGPVRLKLAMGAVVERSPRVGEVAAERLMLVEAAARLLQVAEAQAVRRCLALEEVLVLLTAGSGVAVRSEEAREALKPRALWEAMAARSWELVLEKEAEGAQDHDLVAAVGRFFVLRMEGARRICVPVLSILRQAFSGAVVEVVAQGQTARYWRAQVCRRRGAGEALGTSVSVVSLRAEGPWASQPLSVQIFSEREAVVVRRCVALLEVEGAA